MPRRSLASAIGKFFRKHRENRYLYKILLEDEYRFSLATTRLFSSRGVIENCDIHAQISLSSSVQSDFIRSIPERCRQRSLDKELVSIYLCTDSIVLFTNEVLPKISRPFVLVSGDSDLSVNNKTIVNIDALLSSRYLSMWYAQNLDYVHPKVEPMPIGLDFHSAWQNPRHYRGQNIIPAHQEGELRRICRTSMKFSERKPLVMCDWIGHSSYGDREEARHGIPDEARVVPTHRLPRHELWHEYAKYAFVASPFGVGLDCHRTWEALAMGCVPIVKRSPLLPLFKGMPVLIVEGWSEITADYLKEQQTLFAARKFDYSKLFLSYWAQKIAFKECQTDCVSSLDDMSLLA